MLRLGIPEKDSLCCDGMVFFTKGTLCCDGIVFLTKGTPVLIIFAWKMVI